MSSPPASNFQPPGGGYYPPYDLTYKFNASMAIIVVVLVTTFFFMALFVLYIRRCNMISSAGWPGPNLETQQQQQNQQSRMHHGLDPEVLEKLPIMRYASIKSAKKGKAGPECAVCLLQFDENEQVRLLPDCGHMFHAECIDMWLETHSTCPLCRRSLDQQNAGSGHLQRALSAVISSFRRDPNSPSIAEGRDVVDESREHPDLESGNLDAETEAAGNASSRLHQGDVVRTLSRHSESFKIAVHDMDLIEVREKMLRAKSLRAPNPPPTTTDATAATAASKIHHSQSFAGLFPLHDHHEDMTDEAEKEEGMLTGLRRSVSDGRSLSKRDTACWIDDGETSSNNTVRDATSTTGGNRAVFAGFARRSLKWLGIKDSTAAAVAAADSDASQQDSHATTKTERAKV